MEEEIKTLEDNKWDETAYSFAQQRVQQKRAELTNLFMRKEQDTVILHPGATVSLSACSTWRVRASHGASSARGRLRTGFSMS